MKSASFCKNCLILKKTGAKNCSKSGVYVKVELIDNAELKIIVSSINNSIVYVSTKLNLKAYRNIDNSL